jgi:hypothetical protein
VVVAEVERGCLYFKEKRGKKGVREKKIRTGKSLRGRRGQRRLPRLGFFKFCLLFT